MSLTKIVCILCLLLCCGMCSFKPQEHPLDPTTTQGIILSLLSTSQEQLPVSGASLWVRADDARGSATTWTDRAYGNVLLGAATSVSQAGVGGKPGVLFSGTNYYKGFAVQTNVSNAMSILSVFQRFASSANTIFSGGLDPGGFQLRTSPADKLEFLDMGVASVQVGVTNLNNFTTPYIGTVTYDASGNCSLYENGTLDASSLNLVSFTFDAQGSVAVGARAGGTATFNGYIAEVIAYPRAISASERQLLECYLSKRYAISVPFSCP